MIIKRYKYVKISLNIYILILRKSMKIVRSCGSIQKESKAIRQSTFSEMRLKRQIDKTFFQVRGIKQYLPR